MSDQYTDYLPTRRKRWFWLLSVAVLVAAGIGYRTLTAGLRQIVEAPIELPVPLSEFPLTLGDWEGRDVEIPKSVQKVAGNDDSLSRLYVNETAGQWVNVYVAYTARPRTMLGHRPQVCYVAHGWIHDSTDHIEVNSLIGRKIPCLLHRFRRPAPSSEEMVVLNFYILNGQLTDDESGFDSVAFRTPNIAGEIARYVTQVQISSVLENSVRLATRDFAELVLDYFPNEEGMIKVAWRRGMVGKDKQADK